MKGDIEAIEEKMENRCVGCDFYHNCNSVFNMLIDKGFPSCRDGYIYKIKVKDNG